MADNKTVAPEFKTPASPENTASGLQLLGQINPFTVVGYFSAVGKKTNKPFTAIRVLTPYKTSANGEGYDVELVFLPEDERGKATPDIIGKVAHCDSDILGGKSNFKFLDE